MGAVGGSVADAYPCASALGLQDQHVRQQRHDLSGSAAGQASERPVPGVQVKGLDAPADILDIQMWRTNPATSDAQPVL
jgi:hypothetical protein